MSKRATKVNRYQMCRALPSPGQVLLKSNGELQMQFIRDNIIRFVF